ncbi:MAG: hemolysin family protein [Rubricoccaceae bacterium]|nr:hemolysin family protein [Rubricoccaceae bacterium]
MPVPLLLTLDADLGLSGSGSLTLLVVYIALAIGVSFLCSIMEAVLLSVSPAYVGAMEAERPATAARLKGLKDDIDRPLAAILTLNTVAHTIGAAGAGAEAAAYFGNAYVGVFSAVLTLGILVLSEIIPKTLGAVYWRGLAPFVARMLGPLIWLLYPLVLLSQWLTKLIARGRKEGAVSREEFAALAEIGAEEGVFEEQEARILHNLLRFNALTARDVMTPRTVLVAFPETATVDAVLEEETPFSRLPIYDENRDRVTGYVLKDDVLAEVAADRHDTTLHDLCREILTVPPSLPLPRLFDRLLERREHIALVVGEFGGTEGVVSMEDVMETLLGLEIVDEADRTEDMQVLARRRWAERAAKLGLVPADPDAAREVVQRKRDAVIKLGLTGGEPPDRSSTDKGGPGPGSAHPAE